MTYTSAATPGRQAMAGLLLLAVCVAAYELGGGAKLGEHECLVAQTAREMMASGDYVSPHYGGQLRLRKTPLAYWTAVAVSRLTGRLDEWTVRLPSAAAGVALVMVTAALGTSLFGRRTGLVAGFVAATSVAYFKFTHDATVDMQLALWCTLCYWCFWRGTHAERAWPRRLWMWGCYVSLGVAMLAKAPMPAAVVVLPLLVYWFIVPVLRRGPMLVAMARRGRGGPAVTTVGALLKRAVFRLPQLCVLSGAAIFLIVFLPWVLAVLAQHGFDDVLTRWKSEYLDRYTGDLRIEKDPGAWYYLPYVFGFVLPWALSVPEAVAAAFLQRYRRIRRELWYPLTWFVVTLAFISSAGFKKAHYLLPAVPAMWLLLAPVLERLFFGPQARHRGREAWAALAIVATVLAALVAGGVLLRWWVPAYRDLLPAYTVLALILGFGIGVAGIAFAAGRRAISFVLIGAGSIGGFMWFWPTIAAAEAGNAEALAFAQTIQRTVPPDAELRWLRRQDAQVLFYGERPIGRFMEAIEVLRQLGDRRRDMEAIRQTLGDALDARLRDDEPIWLIMREQDCWALTTLMGTPLRKVASGTVSGKEMVIVTNTIDE